MKKGINQWAFPEDLPLRSVFQLVSDAGFEGIELNLGESLNNHRNGESISLDTNEEDVQDLLRLASRFNLELPSVSTALLWKFPLTSGESSEQEMGKKIVRKMIDVATWLGADTVLVVPGAVDIPWRGDFRPVPYDIAFERSLSGLRELKSYAESKKVNVAIENVWNKFLLSPLEVRDFIDAIGSPFVGAYFDVGNILLTGYPEHWIEILGPRIKRIHVKDFRKLIIGLGMMVGLLQGDVQWTSVIKSLKKIGYDGYLTAELFPYKQHNERLIYETAQAIQAIIEGEGES